MIAVLKPLPQSPLLVHPEPEDARRFVRAGTRLPEMPQGPSPSLPQIPTPPTGPQGRGMSFRGVAGVEDSAERIRYYRSVGPEWTNAEITKALLNSGITQAEVTAAFAMVDGAPAAEKKPFYKKPLFWVAAAGVLGAGTYLTLRNR